EGGVDSLGKRERLRRFTGTTTLLSRSRQLGILDGSLVRCFGLGHLPGRGQFLVSGEAQRRKNSLSEVFLVGVTSVLSSKCSTQQKKPDGLELDPLPPGHGRVGCQDQISRVSEGT